jgi:putative hydrolase of the HAD superfamily
MSYRAAIFDLHGTLVEVFSFRRHAAMLPRMADALELEPEAFVHEWNATFSERAVGRHATIEESLTQICAALGAACDPRQIERAAGLRYDHTRTQLKPRPDAVDTLLGLRGNGLRTGLISDCTPDVPHLWEETPLAPLIDVPVFSCTAGVCKPAAAIYRETCSRLHVDPNQCLYVGDGGSNELTGAQNTGMHAVCLRVEYEKDTYDDYKTDAHDWPGDAVDSLSQLLHYID